ncbi:MAG TPA: DUF480 domain-containing protein [Solirubrobacteraceae bacterium]|nr:DUF480 domain-containing protein [Solirubrobacteraceae bacterium]
MHLAELTPPEQRVLGCLIEKRWTTPDQYPLSLNALRLACNQSTNRDPVTSYDESTVREAAQRLCLYGLARLASGHGSRSVKYRHLAEEALGLGREELAVLAVLLLRGPQTPGELKARTERMAQLGSLDEVERVLGVLSERDYARRIGRRPGQKEDRFEHLLGGAGDREGPGSAPAPAAASAPPASLVTPPAPSPRPAPELSSGPAPELSPRPAPELTPAPAAAPAPAPTPEPAASARSSMEAPASADGNGNLLAERVAALEEEVASLRAELDELRTLYG